MAKWGYGLIPGLIDLLIDGSIDRSIDVGLFDNFSREKSYLSLIKALGRHVTFLVDGKRFSI